MRFLHRPLQKKPIDIQTNIMHIHDSPSENTIQISVFGPGYGESILVHLGGGEWLVVDSCVDGKSKQSVPKNYLESIGVNLKNQVKYIIATHWHDDHVRGLAELFEACSSAHFCCSTALQSQEFLNLAMAYGASHLNEETGIGEFYRILNHSCKTKRVPKWLGENTCIYNRQNNPCQIWSLSLSNAVYTQAISHFASLFPHEMSPRRKISPLKINYSSVVNLIQVGNISILLGADLEECEAHPGWSSIVHSDGRPKFRARVFKIPHHGSDTSRCDQVWNILLEQTPISIVTPFYKGKVHLPTSTDKKWLKGKNQEVYISTTKPFMAKQTNANRAVEKIKKYRVKSRRILNPEPGHVRIRIDLDTPQNPPVVHCFDGAARL